MGAPAKLELQEDTLVVDLADPKMRLATLLPKLRIPLSQVTSVEFVAHPMAEVPSMRPQDGVLPSLRMGSRTRGSELDYVAVSSQHDGLVITLSDQPYSRLIVSVDRAVDHARILREAIQSRSR